MKKLLPILLLLPSLSYADDVLNKLECGRQEFIEEIINKKYEEIAIAKGNIYYTDPEYTKYEFDMVFYLNTTTTSWTLVGYNKDKFGCVFGVGDKFTPIQYGKGT